MQQQPQYGFMAQKPGQINLPNQTIAYAQPSPTLSSAYLINSPCHIQAPGSNGSNVTESSATSSYIPIQNTSPPGFGLASPPAQMFPAMPPQLICSPSPVMGFDTTNLQQAWAIPQIPQWQPIFVQQPMQMQTMPFQVFPQTPTQGSMSANEEMGPIERRSPPRKINNDRKGRIRCKACSAGCRNNSVRDVDPELLKEVMKNRNDLMAQLPEFFGEPLLNFPEFVYYCPIFRSEAIGEMEYYKIPRTTKERELNIPRRLSELFIRTFGPEDAPESKSFRRISPHTELCEVRMAVRNSIVKECPDLITGCRNMEEANGIFDLIFRFVGVAMAKSICPNLPQCFTAVVVLDSENESECTGVVSLFNYHLFRRKIIRQVD